MNGYPVPNADYPLSGRVLLVAVRVALQLPPVEIPDDFGIAIKSWNGNPGGGYIFVARSQYDAINLESSWPLIPSESITYRVKNAQSIWVSATAAPAWVCWSVEQRNVV